MPVVIYCDMCDAEVRSYLVIRQHGAERQLEREWHVCSLAHLVLLLNRLMGGEEPEAFVH
jgi:hypothetical protein